MKTFSTKTFSAVKNNYFLDSYAVWGAILGLEQSFSVLVENNAFLNSMARSLVGNNFGTGSFLIITGSDDLSLSTIIGKNNLFYNSWTEHKGIIKKLNYSIFFSILKDYLHYLVEIQLK